ncbi:hypothetical protein [Spirosoma sp.]|uniref:hypothetical protein n=1 Tax=Spirosoma sp. TaxID=1899569 RepID=UPI003B3A0636
MNLSLTPSLPPARPKTGARVNVYTKDGRSIRVPLRPDFITTDITGGQHAQRQFIRWFTRQSAANPGFPMLVKSILMVNVGTGDCPACNQALNQFLQRFGLADKLRMQQTSLQAGCACQKNGRSEITPAFGEFTQTELDQLISGNADQSQNEFENEQNQEFSPNDVIHPNIDVHAQYALQRMRRSPDPAARVDGNEMVGAIYGERLFGIFKEDQYWPAQLAKDVGMGWWQLIKPGKDAAAVIFENNDKLQIRILVFRDKVRSNPQRLDPALRKAWQDMKELMITSGTILPEVGEAVQTELDQLLADDGQVHEGGVEGEWYKKLAAPLLALSTVFLPAKENPIKPIKDAVVAGVDGAEEARKRRNEAKKDANIGKGKGNNREQETDEYQMLDEIIDGTHESEQEFSPNDVIHPNIDVHAQYSLQRMLRSPDPAARADGAEMLAAVKSGLLDGIYKEDQRVPAYWANRSGLQWWSIILPGEDAALFRQAEPELPRKFRFILIVFRNNVRNNPQRLDSALRKKWRTAKEKVFSHSAGTINALIT